MIPKQRPQRKCALSKTCTRFIIVHNPYPNGHLKLARFPILQKTRPEVVLDASKIARLPTILVCHAEHFHLNEMIHFVAGISRSVNANVLASSLHRIDELAFVGFQIGIVRSFAET